MNDEGFVIEWPLWGLRLDRNQSITVDGTLLYQPTWQQWADTEKRDLVMEYAGYALGSEMLGKSVHSQPPVCMLRLSEVDNNGEPDPALASHTEQAKALVGALRLYRSGDFVDPAETGTYVTYPSGMTAREVHVFRSAFYQYQPDHLYVVGASDAEPLANLAYWVDALRHDRMHTNAVLAIESLCLSFATASNRGERSLHRFIALEAMLGPIGESQAGASFLVRASHAMDSRSPDALEWLKRAGKLRNRLAHNLDSVTLTNDDLQMLEVLTRGVLFSYLTYVSQGGENSESDQPLRNFNRALADGPTLA